MRDHYFAEPAPLLEDLQAGRAEPKIQNDFVVAFVAPTSDDDTAYVDVLFDCRHIDEGEIFHRLAEAGLALERAEPLLRSCSFVNCVVNVLLFPVLLVVTGLAYVTARALRLPRARRR